MPKPNELALTNNFEFDALREANNYRKALLAEFAPSLKGSVIEVGAGIGQITQLVSQLPTVSSVTAVEPDEEFCRMFRQQNPELKLVEGTADALPTGTAANAIICVNVLEHIDDDLGELRKYHSLLKANRGHLCLFVPARQEIYAPIDRDFGHYRRYSKPLLRERLISAGFTVERLNYFNSLGYLAWLVNFKMLGKRKFEAGAVRFYDRVLFPAVHFLETAVTRPPIGQSLIAAARAS